MPSLIQTFRHLRRYQQIARVLTRYGFGHLLIQLSIGRAVAPGLERLRFSAADILRATLFERVRMVIGPALIVPYIQQLWPQWQGAALVLILGGSLLSVLITIGLMISVWRSSR